MDDFKAHASNSKLIDCLRERDREKERETERCSGSLSTKDE